MPNKMPATIEQAKDIGKTSERLVGCSEQPWVSELERILKKNFRRCGIKIAKLAVRQSETKRMFAIAIELDYEGGEQGVQFFVEQEQFALARYPSFMWAEQIAIEIIHRAASKSTLVQMLPDTSPRDIEQRVFKGWGSSGNYK